MEVPELLSVVAKGTKRSVVLPLDPGDPVRISVTAGLSSAGWTVEHCQSLAILGQLTGSESLEFSDRKVMHLVPWPSDKESFTQAITCVKQLQYTDVIGFLSEDFPPTKNKTTATLLSLSIVAERMREDAGGQYLTIVLQSFGLRATPSATRMLLNRMGSNLEAAPLIAKSLSLACGDSKEVTDAVVLESVLYIPEDDGKKTLDDLLHLRALPLARRLQWIPVDQLVPLFRAAASEMVVVHQTAVMVDASEKGWVDPGKAAEEIGVREEAMRSRYMPLAKEIGKDRATEMLARLEQADTVLLRTHYDARDVAMAMAMQICKV